MTSFARSLRLWICRFLNDESGAAYQLSFALVLPLYVLLICFFVELSLLLSVKMGVTHAAFAAARSAAVWLPAADIEESDRTGMVYVAAVNALAPLASSRHRVAASNYFGYPAEAPYAWAEAYARYAEGRHEREYLAEKWRYAAAATRVRIEHNAGAFNAPITVTLEYQHPFHTAGVGRLLGSLANWTGFSFRTTTVSATVTIEKEGFRSQDQATGIQFHEPHAFRGKSF